MTRSAVALSRLQRWGPLVLWMVVISIFSTEAFAASETSRYIGEFAILACLWYRNLAWKQPGWRTRPAVAAFALTVAYAGLDEAHQAFVATRTASLLDVGWDTLGALCGLAGSAAWARRNARAPKEDPPGHFPVPLSDD